MKNINLSKDNFQQINKLWLINRKAIFAFFLADISCIIISSILTNLLYSSNLITKIEVFILTIFWSAFSYIFGRYSTANISTVRIERINLLINHVQYMFVFYILSWVINNRLSDNYYFSYDTKFIFILSFFILNNILSLKQNRITMQKCIPLQINKNIIINFKYNLLYQRFY